MRRYIRNVGKKCCPKFTNKNNKYNKNITICNHNKKKQKKKKLTCLLANIQTCINDRIAILTYKLMCKIKQNQKEWLFIELF